MKVIELDKFVAHLNDEIENCHEARRDLKTDFMQGVAQGTINGLRMAIAYAATIAREEGKPND